MDIRPIHHQEATTSETVFPDSFHQTSSAEVSSEQKATRSSARVRAAKQKAANSTTQSNSTTHEPVTPAPNTLASSSSTTIESISTQNTKSSPLKFTRSRESASGKGKAKEVTQETSIRVSKKSVIQLTTALLFTSFSY